MLAPDGATEFVFECPPRHEACLAPQTRGVTSDIWPLESQAFRLVGMALPARVNFVLMSLNASRSLVHNVPNPSLVPLPFWTPLVRLSVISPLALPPLARWLWLSEVEGTSFPYSQLVPSPLTARSVFGIPPCLPGCMPECPASWAYDPSSNPGPLCSPSYR
jgi:hypothetical protein